VKVTPGPDARVSRAFLVEKGVENGRMRYRLCVDLRRVNKHLRRMGLRYEKLRDFGHLLSKKDILIGFDIKTLIITSGCGGMKNISCTLGLGARCLLLGLCLSASRYPHIFSRNLCW
jgi:hypothetical protein